VKSLLLRAVNRHHLKQYEALLKVTVGKLQISLYIANCVTSVDSKVELQTTHQATSIMTRAKSYPNVPRNGEHDGDGKGEDGFWGAGTTGATCLPSGYMLLIHLVGKSKTITGKTSILALVVHCPDAALPGSRVCATR